jgi:hypothetical protein
MPVFVVITEKTAETGAGITIQTFKIDTPEI